MSLQIIGAGFGRTGTMSLKVALEQLGFGPCYHMVEVIESPERATGWIDAANGGAVCWDDIFDGYRATVDWPACRFWRQLAEHYPEAKVLLSLREAAGWHKSIMNTIYKVMSLAPAGAGPGSATSPISVARKLVLEDTFDGRLDEPDYAIEVFERHNRTVRDTIAPDRLLVYEPGQGWDPLCQFLGVPVPDGDYPHENTTQAFVDRIQPLVEKARE